MLGVPFAAYEHYTVIFIFLLIIIALEWLIKYYKKEMKQQATFFEGKMVSILFGLLLLIEVTCFYLVTKPSVIFVLLFGGYAIQIIVRAFSHHPKKI